MKLFILGGGYVGMALLSRLKNHNHTLYVSCTHTEKVQTLKAYTEHVVLLKGSDQREIAEVIDKCDGCFVFVAPKDQLHYEDTYLNTARSLALSLEKKTKPFYLLYTSSTSVYRGLENDWAREDLILHPDTQNAQILLETENIYLNCANRNIATCILRLGGIYGPHRELIERARRLSAKEMDGGGEWTNHIHLEDIVHAAEYCLNQRLSGIYNLVNNDHPTRKDLYTNLCQSINVDPPKWNPSVNKSSGYRVSNEKIHRSGYTFIHPSLKTS